MRTLCVLILILLSTQQAIAKKTWERVPTTWSLEECQNVIDISPWRSECYQPLQGDNHYLVEAKWLSPVFVCAEARCEQLEAGEDLEFLYARYQQKMEEEGLIGRKMITIIVYPKKGLGMVGQQLRELMSADPFFTGLQDNIKLVRNRKKDDFLTPVEFKPLPGGFIKGFQVKFENDGFITPRTWRAELLLETGAGEFKFKFEPRKMRPTEVKFKKLKK